MPGCQAHLNQRVAGTVVMGGLASGGLAQRQSRLFPDGRLSVGGPAYPGGVGTEEADPAGLAERYEDLVDELTGIPGVTPPRGGSGFGRSAVRYQGKIFVMLVRGRLVLKLPADRVSELAGSGDGVHFDANKGTPMKEWLSLDPDSDRDWLPLAREALEFARGHAR